MDELGTHAMFPGNAQMTTAASAAQTKSGLGGISRPCLSRWQIRFRFGKSAGPFARLPQGNSADLPKRNSVLANPPARKTWA